MKTLNNCEICFDNPNKIYRPGDYLTGQVETNFNSNKIVRGIIVEITGRATVYWCQYYSSTPIYIKSNIDSPVPNSVSYTNKEKYITEKFYIIGRKDERMKLLSGYHVYPFKYLLPSHLPSTFEGTAGTIRYVMRAILDCPWKINKLVETPFIIDSLRYIREHPMAQASTIVTIEKQFGTILKTKPLKTVVKASHSGFSAGGEIQLAVEVINNSHVVLNCILVTLKQVLTFHATNTRKKETKLLSKNNFKCRVKPNESNSFDLVLKVPKKVALYDLTDCRIMHCDYKIKVELHTFGAHRNLAGWMPVYPLKTISGLNNNSILVK